MDTASSNPPRGDYQKAEKYISQLCTLIDQNKIEVVHTDLQKFNPNTIQDHYRVALEEYHIEISHSKLPNSGSDSYVMLFTNLKNVAAGSAEKTILAYTQLSDTQFHTFKQSAETQIEDRRRAAEEKRFTDALSPIDSLLNQATSKETEELSSPREENKTAEPVERLPSYSTIASNNETYSTPAETDKTNTNPYV